VVGRFLDVPFPYAADLYCHPDRDHLFFSRGRNRDPWSGQPPPESALEIPKKRYAKGEITKEEFDRIKKDLRS
jgi:hypothetical protein